MISGDEEPQKTQGTAPKRKMTLRETFTNKIIGGLSGNYHLHAPKKSSNREDLSRKNSQDQHPFNLQDDPEVIGKIAD